MKKPIKHKPRNTTRKPRKTIVRTLQGEKFILTDGVLCTRHSYVYPYVYRSVRLSDLRKTANGDMVKTCRKNSVHHSGVAPVYDFRFSFVPNNPLFATLAIGCKEFGGKDAIAIMKRARIKH